MKKLMLGAAGLAGMAGVALVLPTPALSQQPANLGEIIVYGTDPCPRSTDDQVVICRRLPESMRYRIPENLRTNGSPQENTSWGTKSQVLKTVGDVGTGSCSAVGPGGHSGCLVQQIREAREQRRQQAEDYQPPQ